jgi:hypothetical protein
VPLSEPIVQPSDADIGERLRQILASEEFQPRAVDRLGQWFAEHDAELSAWLASLHGVGRLFALLFLALAVAALVWAIQAWLVPHGAPRERQAVGSVAEALDATPAALLALARALADAGSLREAARALQTAALRAACDERELVWRPALSDGEWLSLLGPAEELVALTRATQHLAFGPGPTRAAFDACERAARGLLGTRAAGSAP